ncbi:uncharacterized protein LOC114468662 isoform X2 [Gouania willdenowi]|uniref:uncharacterized protein LOC114468662 isoform X2 n=1 Tax=Gouania willdenowi TaxID=441366 RepID=UPI0010562A15|nr:uncharacterized protein LOC114468662 isoform X2 [Gouania willdenowi]
MSVNGSNIAFEGFLQKRKEILKMRWVTYWFRLQDDALSFYAVKNGSASHLIGQYSIISFQSVQEVQRATKKRFMFVITMTNGNKKVLAAETAALRQQWVEHVCKAMYLSSNSVSDTHDSRIDPLHMDNERLNGFSALNTEEEERQDGDYDVLPCRNKVCEEQPSAECVYDVPQFCRNSTECQESTESVYDVPSSLMRKWFVHTSDEETYWKI